MFEITPIEVSEGVYTFALATLIFLALWQAVVSGQTLLRIRERSKSQDE